MVWKVSTQSAKLTSIKLKLRMQMILNYTFAKQNQKHFLSILTETTINNIN